MRNSNFVSLHGKFTTSADINIAYAWEKSAEYTQEPTNMESETVSNAQSLRVIGQHLHNLVISSFELEKRSDHYIVVVNRREPASFLYFNNVDICSVDVQARLPRCKANSVALAHNLSSSMRVLGDYLDRKGAKDFVLSWFPDFVRFRFNNHEEQKFSVHQNLYDLGVCMYMKRSAASPIQTSMPRANVARGVLPISSSDAFGSVRAIR